MHTVKPNALFSWLRPRSEIVFYDTIRELPIFRLNEFQIHLLQDAGIGSTLFDLDKRFDMLDTQLAAGNVQEAFAERLNSRLGLYLLFDSISTKSRCLADLVYSLDGNVVTDFSDENLLRISKEIDKRLSFSDATQLIETLKKKYNDELKTAFPELFDDLDSVDFYSRIIQRALLQVDSALNDTDNANAIQEVDRWLLDQMRPGNFDFEDPKNIVDAKRRQFEQVCTGLAFQHVPDAETLTAYKFYSRIVYLQKHPQPARHESTY